MSDEEQKVGIADIPANITKKSDPLKSVLRHLEITGGFTLNHTPLDKDALPALTEKETDTIAQNSKQAKPILNPLTPVSTQALQSLNTASDSHSEMKEDIDKPLSPHLIVSNLDLEFIKELKRLKILPSEFPDKDEDFDTDEDYEKAGIEIIHPYGDETSVMNPDNEKIPQSVIVHVPNMDTLQRYEYLYQDISNNYWNIDPSRRPPVIFYSNHFKLPLYLRQNIFDGFLFASTPDELKKAANIAKDLIKSKESKSFQPQDLEPEQEKSYDESLDLREWERKTADTYQTLRLLLEGINKHLEPRYKTPPLPQTYPEEERKSTRPKPPPPPPINPVRGLPIRAILDLGTGDGRIAEPLARLGYKVMGIDISQGMLDRGKERFKEEGEGLRGEKEHPGLSYEALLRLQKEGLLPYRRYLQKESEKVDIILDDTEAEQNYIRVKGSFFEVFKNLNNAVKEWSMSFPQEIDGKRVEVLDFFEVDRYSGVNPFWNPHNMFEEMGFDKVICTWNTFWEVGDKKNQEAVIGQLLWLLPPGGEVTIEIADRDMSPYKEAIEEHHKNHPEDPLGTIQDKKPDNKGNFPKRYLSDVNDLADMFRAKGFETKFNSADLEKDNPESDVRLFYIESEDPNTGEKKLNRVYQITARTK